MIVLFVGQILTALTMSGYEEVLQKIVLLSYFVPLLIASGGNSGSQAATLIIRALATDDIKSDGWKMVLKKEGSSGLMLGSILGVLGFATLIVWGLIDGDPMNMELVLKASVVASSLLLIVVLGNVIGEMLPFILSITVPDPAVSSAPFVATIVDVSGIIIYFSIAVFLLSGILL